MVPLLNFLVDQGVVQPLAAPTPTGAVEQMLAAYRTFLLAERGLAPLSVLTYLRNARVFLSWLPAPLDEALHRLSPGSNARPKAPPDPATQRLHRRSRVLACCGGAELPVNCGSISLSARTFLGRFCDMHMPCWRRCSLRLPERESSRPLGSLGELGHPLWPLVRTISRLERIAQLGKAGL
jgi:hypothetical protein